MVKEQGMQNNQDTREMASNDIKKEEDKVQKETRQEQNLQGYLSQESLGFFNNLITKLNLDNNQKELLWQEIIAFVESLSEKEQGQEAINQRQIVNKMQEYWGDRYEQNLLFIKRAFLWLGFKESTNDDENFLSFDVISKLAELGKMLSEDGNIGEGEGSFAPTKKEAMQMRKDITNQKDFNNIMFNKTHPSRQKVMEKLNYLNGIIAQGTK